MDEKHKQVTTFLHGRRGQILIGDGPTLLQHHPWTTDSGPALLQALWPPAHPKEPCCSPKPLLCSPTPQGSRKELLPIPSPVSPSRTHLVARRAQSRPWACGGAQTPAARAAHMGGVRTREGEWEPPGAVPPLG